MFIIICRGHLKPTFSYTYLKLYDLNKNAFQSKAHLPLVIENQALTSNKFDLDIIYGLHFKTCRV